MFSERIAINNQYIAKSIEDADTQFKKSCEMCCNSPSCLWKDCDRCKVAAIHREVVELLKSRISTEE